MKKQLILIFFLLALIGCSKKVLVDKSTIEKIDSTKIEVVKIEDIIKDAIITDSSEIVVTTYEKPDSLGKQSISQIIQIKKRQKTIIKEKKEILFKVDSSNIVKSKEKKDIFEKKVTNMWQYVPIIALLLLIIIIYIYIRWRK